MILNLSQWWHDNFMEGDANLQSSYDPHTTHCGPRSKVNDQDGPYEFDAVYLPFARRHLPLGIRLPLEDVPIGKEPRRYHGVECGTNRGQGKHGDSGSEVAWLGVGHRWGRRRRWQRRRRRRRRSFVVEDADYRAHSPHPTRRMSAGRSRGIPKWVGRRMTSNSYLSHSVTLALPTTLGRRQY